MKALFGKQIIGLVLVVTLVGVVNTLAQSVQDNPSRGSKVGNSYSVGDIETINLTNGNLMINFPLGSLPAGRGGVSGGISLVYNSKLYDIETQRILHPDPPPSFPNPFYFNKSVVVPSNTGGWRFASGYNLESENRMDSYGENVPGCTNQGTEQPFYYVNTYRHKLFVVSPDGGRHEMIPHGYDDYLDDGFYEPKYDGTVYSCGTGYVNIGTALTYYSIDGTYMRLEVAAYGSSWTLYFADGGKATSDGKVYDRNGNYVQTSGSYPQPNVWTADDVTDEFGRTVDRSTDTNGDTLITSKGVGGEDIVWRVKWKQIWVSKTYQSCDEFDATCPVGHRRSGLDLNFYVVDKIIQPEQLGGGEYVFQYNGASSNPSGLTDGWGELSGITLPSGASVTYDYAMDGEDGPEDFEDTKKILRNHVEEKNLTYNLEYDGSSTPTTDTWTYMIEPTFGSMAGPNGAGTGEEFETTEAALCYPQPCEQLPLSWNSGLTHTTTNPDGSKVEKIWAQNKPVASDHMDGNAAFNPYVKTEFTSIKSGGSYTLTAIKDYTYDKNGNVTEIKEYDWMPYATAYPSGVPTVPSGTTYLKRITKTEYYNDAPTASSTTYTDADSYHLTSSKRLLRLPKSVTVQDASETTKSRTEFTYDHTDYGSSNMKAGNVTVTRNWDSTKGSVTNPLTDGNSVKSQATYNGYGMPLVTTDPNGVETTITYGCIDGSTGTCSSSAPADLYPTKIEAASNYSSLKRTSSSKYDFHTGLVTEAKDVDNNVIVKTIYDDLGRPTKVKSAYGTALESWTQTTYNDEDRYVIVKSDLETVGDGKKVAVQHFDQIGRVRLSRTLENASTQSATNETDGIKVQSRYRYQSATNSGTYTLTSNPFRAATSSQASSEPTMGWTVSYENASGTIKTTESFAGSGLPSLWGSNTNSTGKSEETEDANTTTIIDEAGKKRRTVTDALGRLIRVDEPDANGDLGSGSNPNQDTNYTYDILGNLTQIVQGGQTRTFSYSSLSRLLSSTNPESGMFTYTYDNNGNLLVKTDARSITTTHTYDALNRVTLKNYSGSTPDVAYTYDDTQVPFSKGKLTKVASSVSETHYSEFDEQERITESRQTTAGRTYTFGYTYNLDDDLLTQTYPSGKVVAFDYNVSGDLEQVGKQTSNGQFVYANSFAYAPHGQVEKMRLGNGKWETTQFNSSRQITQIGLGHSATNTGFLKINYDYGELQTNGTVDATKNNGNLAKQTITVPTIAAVTGFTAIQGYTYDSLDRLKSATEKISTTETWKQTFNYDRFGNKNFDTPNTTTLGSCPTGVCNPTADQANNRLNNHSYDTAGNITTDAESRTFAYDAENLQTSATGTNLSVSYSYDGNNKRIMSYNAVANQTTIFVYDASGKLSAEYTVNIPPPTTPVISYLTEDTLGSVRVTTNSFGEMKARRDFLPFGEELYAGIGNRNTNQKYSSNADDTSQKFATYQRDLETGLDFAQSRYYSPAQGRFTSPDEFKGGPDELFDFEEDASDNPTFYADLENPQSLNKYQYGYNNPYKFNDPTGHCPLCALSIQEYVIPRYGPIIETGLSMPKVVSTAAATIRTGVTRTATVDPILIPSLPSSRIFAKPRAGMEGAISLKNARPKNLKPVSGPVTGKPNTGASGPHSTKRPTSGPPRRYTTWEKNPKNPTGKFTPRKSVDTQPGGKPHTNKKTGQRIPTPHTQSDAKNNRGKPRIPGGVRPGRKNELP